MVQGRPQAVVVDGRPTCRAPSVADVRTWDERDERVPAPLTRRRRPVRTAWRGVLWRWRFAVAALALGVAVSSALETLRPPPAPVRPVVVAARDLPAGTTIARTDLRVAHVPAGLAVAGAATVPGALVGRGTAVAVPAGLPVVPELLASGVPGGPPGTVVAAVRFGDPAVAALLAPGAHVDVLAAAVETGGQGVVVAHRALVLPVAAPADADHGAGWSVGLTGDEAPPVLLAVTPQEAAALSGSAVAAVLSAVVVP